MATLRRFLPVLVLSFCALFTIAPQAESVENLTIESGFLAIGCPCFDYPVRYYLQGPGVTLSGDGSDYGYTSVLRGTGSTHVFSLPNLCDQLCVGQISTYLPFFLEVDGVRYEQPYSIDRGNLPPLLYEGVLNLTWTYTESLQFAPRDEVNLAVIQAPFMMTGDITGHSLDTREELFHLALTGHGTATIRAQLIPSIEGYP